MIRNPRRNIGEKHPGRGLRRLRPALLAIALVVSTVSTLQAQDPPSPDRPARQAPAGSDKKDLTNLSIDELMNIEVTSVGRKVQPLSDAAAAVTVIRGEDIRQTGVTSIAESLRMVPGMEVARLSSNVWAVSARGFNSPFSNKLEVRMDGRSAYTPLFSGVYWDTFDTFLEDIDRIEVIRGPGGTLWGANAVNGVVNVTTKSAKDTQGFYVYGGGGTEERVQAGARYGGQVGESVFYRAYVKYHNVDESWKGSDPWHQSRAGFRTDWIPDPGNTLTLQGDVYQGVTHQLKTFVSPAPPFAGTYKDAEDVSGGNILARWEHTLSKDSQFSLQASYDQYRRSGSRSGETVGVADLDFQYRMRLFWMQDVVWGAGYRNMQDHTRNSFDVGFSPDHRKQDLLSAFVQDEIPLSGKDLTLTVGCKFEHNDFSGLEYQPSGRMLWKLAEKQSLWAALSRAVRTPSRADENLEIVAAHVPSFPPTEIRIRGNSDVVSEHLTALELGYRIEPVETLSFDVAAFHNWYDRLVSAEPGAPSFVGGTLILPIDFGNGLQGRTYGVEVSAMWRVLNEWTLRGSYSLLRMDITAEPSSADVTTARLREGSSPQHQARLRSSLELSQDLGLDVSARFTSGLPALGVLSYAELDARLRWMLMPNFEAALVGQNLLSRHHAEFGSGTGPVVPSDLDRGGYVELTVRF